MVGVSDFYAGATDRFFGSGTAAERELAQLANKHPRAKELVRALTAERKLIREAGCQNFGEYLPGPDREDGVVSIRPKSGDRFEGQYFQQGSWVNIQHDWRKGRLTDVEFRNFAILGSWRWGARFFGVAGVKAENMTISGVKEEHGWYLNLAKTNATHIPVLDWDRVLVENIGSQVLQTVVRPHETLDFVRDTDIDTGPIRVKNSVFRNFHLTSVGEDGKNLGGKRPAQTMQLKASPNNVELRNNLWDNTAVPLSYGCLTILGKSDRNGVDASFRKAFVDQCVMRTAPSQQKPIWAQNIDLFRLTRSHVETMGGKEPIIQLDGVRRILIENCTGNVRLVVNGQDVGRITDGYTKGFS